MIIPILLLLLIAIYNGLIIQWFNNKNKESQNKYSVLWHITGWLIRLFIILLFPIKYLALSLFIGWSCYNYIINLILNKPLFYVGNTFIDKYLNKTIQIIIDVSLLLLIIFTFAK